MKTTSWDEAHLRDQRDYRRPPAGSVIEFLPVLREAGAYRVLDFGCGAGRHSVLLAREGFLVVGMDPSQVAISRADEWLRSEGLKNAILLVGGGERLPFPDGQLDAVIAISVIHHGLMQQIKERVREIRRVLASGGLAVMTVDSDQDYKAGRGRQLEEGTYELDIEGHKESGIIHHFFSEDEIRSVLSESFEIVNLKHLVEKADLGDNCHWEAVMRA